jgi:hypothetical protein
MRWGGQQLGAAQPPQQPARPSAADSRQPQPQQQQQQQPQQPGRPTMSRSIDSLMAHLQARWQISVMSAPLKPCVNLTSRS